MTAEDTPMFAVRYVTDTYVPDLRIVLRTAADGWEATDIPGVHRGSLGVPAG